jgi:DNA-binding NtrC family response regulator
MARIIIVDDEEEMCRSLAEILEGHGHEVVYTVDPSHVQELVADKPPDAVLMDIRMPQTNGIDLLGQLRSSSFDGHVIMISGYASVDNVVSSMKAGATNFYRKPLDIPALLEELSGIAKARDRRRHPAGTFADAGEGSDGSDAGEDHTAEAQAAPATEQQTPESSRIISNDPVMKRAVRSARKAAPSDAPVLLTGETGSGKEVVATSIVEASMRADGPFLKLNCAAMPDNLLESELFGHEAGAFTDARAKHRGKLELADGGTLFFDEIGDMSLGTQAKLLRVLQDWKFQRLGGNETLSVDVRVIAATNKDLRQCMERGAFREDLYYRLAVVELKLPPLRQRTHDILPLCDYFLREFSEKYGKRITRYSPEVRSVLLSHPWPGNVRELRNIVERAAIFCESDTIGVEHLPETYRDGGYMDLDGAGNRLTEAGEALTRQMILDALKECNGVKQRAADLLNIHRKTLYNRMKKLGIR